MARRAHTKSRSGCFTCKRRHIKCDEQRPTCTNCRISLRTCSYQEERQRSRTRDHSSSAVTSPATSVSAAVASPSASVSTVGPAPTPQSSVPETSFGSSADGTLPLAHHNDDSPNDCNLLTVPLPESANISADDLVINIRHMQYLTHFLLVTCHSIGLSLPSLGEERAVSFIMTAALRAPHLLHAMLSLAALHLGHRTDAAAFQTRALELFVGTSHIINITPDSAASTFQFASLVGIYKLADVSLTCDGDEAALLDRFLEYVDVHNGVRAVIGASWSSISQSGLRPSIAPFEEDIQRFQQHHGNGEGECDQLQDLLRNLEAGEMSADTLESYRDAIRHLRWAFDLERRCPRSQTTPAPGAVFAWPVMLSSNFVMLLQQRRPEALLILAYYGALLHKHREFWVIGSIGSRVVGAVTTLLGRYWRPWLEWPNAIVTETGL